MVGGFMLSKVIVNSYELLIEIAIWLILISALIGGWSTAGFFCGNWCINWCFYFLCFSRWRISGVSPIY